MLYKRLEIAELYYYRPKPMVISSEVGFEYGWPKHNKSGLQGRASEINWNLLGAVGTCIGNTRLGLIV